MIKDRIKKMWDAMLPLLGMLLALIGVFLTAILGDRD